MVSQLLFEGIVLIAAKLLSIYFEITLKCITPSSAAHYFV